MIFPHSRQPELLVPLLVQRLSDDYSYTKTAAILALAEYGDKARVAVPRLRQLLNDGDEQVRGVAKTALEKIEGAPARSSLTDSN